MNPVNYIFVHHTAVSYALNPDQWIQTNDYHRTRQFPLSSLGFYIGYNYEISKNGTVRQARKEGEETAAVIGFNFNSVSICLDGNFDIEMPTPEQIKSLTSLLTDVSARHNVPFSNILPHRCSYDLKGTPREKTCYGSLLSDDWARNLLQDKNAKIRDLLNQAIALLS